MGTHYRTPMVYGQVGALSCGEVYYTIDSFRTLLNNDDFPLRPLFPRSAL